ncbi:protein ROOT HAIR DEFECTIVE 3 [Artemisia annua]|uniref:Protein ROOT HAIR DEFECTIVE 3 n=1 Tax=Artemisia annua TaxID=35608 RepID=A0A2U1PSE4_ARTAN|nr:protein ROOT HAIR DEFECTIVE 3 [Artemisia annua]
MDHKNKCYSTQFIDGNGAFSADKLDNFIKEVELEECGSSYAVVAIMGPQSSGKSTLLNHLFLTDFREMNASYGRYQTTRGTWIAKCPGIEPPTIVLDLEGTDGSERGEDDMAFENQSALFLLAICDIVLINMYACWWCHDIGREHASSKPLLRTVFMAMLRLFGPRKITLMFIVRDKTKIWDCIPKPEANKDTPLSDVFNIQVVVLVSYEEKEEQFRQQFFQSIAPSSRQVVVPASDFSLSAQRIWKVIKANKDLDLPAHKDWIELKDAIESQLVQGFANEDSKAAQSHLVLRYGDTLKSLFYKCLSSYDDATYHYETSVRLAERNQLEEKLVQLVQPAYQLLLKHLQSVTLKNSKTEFDHALNGGQGFAMAARNCTEKFTRLFDEQYAFIQQASWDSANIRVRFSHDLRSLVTNVRTAKLSELTTRCELKLKEALYGRVEAFLKGGRGDVWPAIREYYNCETQKVVSEFSFAFSSFEMDEHDKADMISKLMNYARGRVKLKTKEVAKEVLYIMIDRFNLIFNHDNDLNPRSWTLEEDIQAIKRTAQISSLKVLSVLAAIRLDEDTDTIYDTLVYTLLDERRKETAIPNDSLASSSWAKISNTIITPRQCKSLWDDFLSETMYTITQATATQEAKKKAKKDKRKILINVVGGFFVVVGAVGVVSTGPAAAPVAAITLAVTAKVAPVAATAKTCICIVPALTSEEFEITPWII